MDHIIADVKIKIPLKGQKKILRNFEINSGVVPANSDKYDASAMIPKQDWRPLTSEESECLFIDKLDVENQVISILGLNSKLQEKFSRFDGSTDSAEMYSIYQDMLQNDDEFQQEFFFFLKNLLKPGISLGTLSLLCLGQMEPNLNTVATRGKEGKYCGLHFDHSEISSLQNKKNNRSRISINIGEEHRYVLFVNIGYEKVFELVRLNKPDLSENITEIELANEFFKFYPNYPVIRYKQERFHCYVAPTDYIIHDGSTINKIKRDKSIVYLGHFNTGGIS